MTEDTEYFMCARCREATSCDDAEQDDGGEPTGNCTYCGDVYLVLSGTVGSIIAMPGHQYRQRRERGEFQTDLMFFRKTDARRYSEILRFNEYGASPIESCDVCSGEPLGTSTHAQWCPEGKA